MVTTTVRVASQQQIERWAKQVVKAYRERLNGAQRLLGDAQQKAFLAVEVLRVMRTIDEETGQRISTSTFVAVHDLALHELRFESPFDVEY